MKTPSEASQQLEEEFPEDVDMNDSVVHSVDPVCKAILNCVSGSGNHRKVVSHIFGRNKISTKHLPDVWIRWCRKHYQQLRYRSEVEDGSYHQLQLSLVRDQLEKFEWTGVIKSWTVALHKTEQSAIDAEEIAMRAIEAPQENGLGGCWERFLLPHLGSGKSYEEVDQVLDIIEAEFSTPAFLSRKADEKKFPKMELLPTFYDENLNDRPSRQRARARKSSSKSPSTHSLKAQKLKSLAPSPSLPVLESSATSSSGKSVTSQLPKHQLFPTGSKFDATQYDYSSEKSLPTPSSARSYKSSYLSTPPQTFITTPSPSTPQATLSSPKRKASEPQFSSESSGSSDDEPEDFTARCLKRVRKF